MTHRDYIGTRYGRLTAILEAPPKIRKNKPYRMRRFNCRCDCGNETVALAQDLVSGNTKSCGCWKIEATKIANTTHGRSISVSRGGKATPEYHSWCGMIARCESEKHISYRFYGARGIEVCKRWRHSFEAFLSDMGEKPSARHSIDRIDSDGNYEPENCRWATTKEQFNNSRVSQEFKNHIGRYAKR